MALNAHGDYTDRSSLMLAPPPLSYPSYSYNSQGDLLNPPPPSSSFPSPFPFPSPSYNSQGDLIRDDLKQFPSSPLLSSPTPFQYPSLYNSDIQPNATSIELSKAERKREKKDKKHLKKMEKMERKRQRVEDKMKAKQPAHMHILALPLVAGHDLVLLTTNHVPPGRARGKIEEKWHKSFLGMHAGAVNTLKGRTLRWTNRKFEGLSPETRLMGSAPKHIQRITLMHPSSETEEKMFDDLVNLIITSKHKHKTRVVLYAIALPFIAAAEALAPVWPNILTVVDAAFLLFHIRAFQGSRRLARFVASEKEKVHFAESGVIDKWIDILAANDYGVLEEDQIMEMCYEIGAPDLIGTLCELRRRHLRQTNQNSLLPPKQR